MSYIRVKGEKDPIHLNNEQAKHAKEVWLSKSITGDAVVEIGSWVGLKSDIKSVRIENDNSEEEKSFSPIEYAQECNYISKAYEDGERKGIDTKKRIELYLIDKGAIRVRNDGDWVVINPVRYKKYRDIYSYWEYKNLPSADQEKIKKLKEKKHETQS